MRNATASTAAQKTSFEKQIFKLLKDVSIMLNLFVIQMNVM